MEMRKRSVILVSLYLFLFFTAVSECIENNLQHNKDSKHFVLVHGACLGAWSWYKLIPLLKSYGHVVTAIVLAASGINLVHANDLQSFSNYTQPLMDFMASIPPHQTVILVGHSLGGAVISQAMENFPKKVSVGVFLTAAMPGPSLSFSTIAQKIVSRLASAPDNKFTYGEGANDPPTAFLFGPKYLSEVVFQHSPPEDSALAITLVRQTRLLSGEELVFSEAKYGSVSRVFIVSEEDQVITEPLQKWMIENNPPSMVLRIGGSDHMVMMSQPTQLLAHLQSVVHKYS